MDSISNRGNQPQIEYMISGDPPLPHHLQTLKNAERELGHPVTLSLVLNVLKKDERLFSIKESVALARKMADYMGIEISEIMGHETKDAVSLHLDSSDKIIRRNEGGLNSDSPYIKEMAEKYGVPDFPKKIEWVKSNHPESHTSGRLKALVFASLRHPDEKIARVCREQALKIAPEFMVQAIEEKINENPNLHFLLSITPDVDKYFQLLD